MNARLLLPFAAVLMILLGGCLREAPRDASSLRLAGIDVAAPSVSSGSVTLAIHASLDNAGGESGLVRVVAKAFDTATGLLVANGTADMGKIPGDRTPMASILLRVPRESGYRIDVSVYEDDRLTQASEVVISSVATLQPNLFDAGVRVSSMDFMVQNATDGRATIQAKVYVTNEAAGPSRPLRMQVKAREVTTSLVSDEASVGVEAVLPEETKAVAVNLTVPAEYNYEIEAVLWQGDIVVERGAGRVQLLPTFTKDKSQEVVVTKPNLSDFITPRTPTPAAASGGGLGTPRVPGLELALAALGIGGAAWVASTRRR